MACFEITFYSQYNGAEIDAELVNLPDEDSANRWALDAVGEAYWICWSITEVKKEGK